MRKLLTVVALSGGLCFLTATASATPVLDPVGDFFPLLDPSAPRNGDLDVVSAETFLAGDALLFTATMDDVIGTTALGFYVWGVDRGAGAGTLSFAHLGLPDIVFDALVIAFNDGSGLVNLFPPGGGPPAPTPLAAGSVTIADSTIDVRVPLALLPSNGLSPRQYEWNLWPRWNGVPFGDTQITDFAPDATNAPVTAPEPSSLALLAFGLAAGGGRAWRRRAAA